MALDGQFDVIVHGCNCFCTMGSGVARQIREKFPEAYQADKNTARGDYGKLGAITSARIEANDLTVVNAYTQFRYGAEKMHVDYKAVRECFKKIAKQFKGKKIAFPAIGCGLAGGDWNIVSKIIDEELAGEDYVFVEYSNEPLVELV